jgi:hypothetical protein
MIAICYLRMPAARFQKLHPGPVSEHVWRHALFLQRRHCFAATHTFLAYGALDGVAAEPVVAIAHDERLRRRATARVAREFAVKVAI